MPIEGLSSVMRLPRIGKIRLGVKDVSQRTGNEYPKAVDHFVVQEDESTSALAAANFRKVYGDKPRELRILIPVEDNEIYFSQYLKMYGATGLLCKGDANKAMRLDKGTGALVEVECDTEECPHFQKGECKRLATFSFMLPDVDGIGVWQIDTTSKNTIINLNSDLQMVKVYAGRVRMIPLALQVVPKEVTAEGKKKVIYVLRIDLTRVSASELRRLGAAPTATFALEAGDENRIPDDLYARSQWDPSAQPASSPAPQQAPGSTIDVAPSIPEPQGDPPVNPTEEQITILFKSLRFTQAKQTLYRKRYESDPEGLLSALREEAQADADGPSPEPEKPRPAPVTPIASKSRTSRPQVTVPPAAQSQPVAGRALW